RRIRACTSTRRRAESRCTRLTATFGFTCLSRWWISLLGTCSLSISACLMMWRPQRTAPFCSRSRGRQKQRLHRRRHAGRRLPAINRNREAALLACVAVIRETEKDQLNLDALFEGATADEVILMPANQSLSEGLQ